MASEPRSSSVNFIHNVERLDQHFLDPATTDSIVGAATILPSDIVLDIGAGNGILTSAILRRSPTHVLAIEPDRRCRSSLERVQRNYPNLTIKLDRIQHIPRSDLSATSLIIANPPFSVLEHLPRLVRELPALRQAIMCVGRRWAEAVTATVGSPRYGVTSIAIQSRFSSRTVGVVDGSSFTPPIRRPAALVEINRLPAPDPGLDLLALAALQNAGSRLKDLVRSERLRRAIGPDRQQTVLHDARLRRIQQRRLRELTTDQISELATLLKPGAAD